MKLSEAIRLGAMMKPQATVETALGSAFTATASCALGSAGDAIGDTEDIGFYGRIKARFPVLLTPVTPPVPCGWTPDRSLFWAIIALNDSARWTRERIADWVESIENAQAAPVVTEQEARQC